MAYFNLIEHENKIKHIKKFGNIMVDLETLSTQTNASITEIAAIEFNKVTGEIGDIFHECIDYKDWTENNRHVEGRTILWWMEQDNSLIKKFKEKNPKLHTVLQKFRTFYNEHTLTGDDATILWGNGSTMDITILQSAYEYFKEPIPWQYWAVNDVRTIVNLNPKIKEDCTFIGDKHNPIDDCKHQVKYLVETLNSLKNEF